MEPLGFHKGRLFLDHRMDHRMDRRMDHRMDHRMAGAEVEGSACPFSIQRCREGSVASAEGMEDFSNRRIRDQALPRQIFSTCTDPLEILIEGDLWRNLDCRRAQL